MPENGRDVQCSACGHAWFQRGPHVLEDNSPAPVTSESPPDKSTIAQEGSPSGDQPSDTSETASAHDSAQSAEDDKGNVTAGGAPSTGSVSDEIPSRRELSPDVQAILQEEAQRELEARQSQQEQLETQTEMGLDEVDEEEAQRKSIRERMARLRGADDEFEATEALPEGRGRDLLPDIEEINSTLDAAQDDQPEYGPDLSTPPRTGGFRRGFLTIALIALVLLLVYAYAPAISDTIPQAKSPLESYVSFVDQARIGLNGLMESAIQKMQGASADAG